MPSSPIAVAGSSGAVFGVVAEPPEDVAVALPLRLDLLLGVVATVPDDVRLADRLGGGTGATVGATPPTVAGVTAAEVIDGSAVLPDTEAGANPVGDAGWLPAVVELTLEMRKIAPAITATAVTAPPTATAGAIRMP